jgi:radical SAM/Cys-rich protein
VIDRCNLTILNEPGFEDLAEFLAREGVEITASLPCYTKDNVDRQRGEQVFDSSILALTAQRTRLRARHQTRAQSRVQLSARAFLRRRTGSNHYKRELAAFRHRVQPALHARQYADRASARRCHASKFASYMALLHSAHNPDNLDGVMCRTLVSVDYRGFLYDCDFNQMLGIPMIVAGRARRHVTDLLSSSLDGAPIAVADHCYGCTAGQGSSCGGALA